MPRYREKVRWEMSGEMEITAQNREEATHIAYSTNNLLYHSEADQNTFKVLTTTEIE